MVFRVIVRWQIFVLRFVFLSVLMSIFILSAFPQMLVDTASRYKPSYKTVVAGKQYEKNSFYQWLWGSHYRKDWTTPVRIKMLNLDTVNGGLKAYEEGGGRQTRSLRLKNTNGKEYVLRSIDKSYKKALPEIYRGTFIERIMNDQVSMAEPYATITIPPMADAAGIYHTDPKLVFIPDQKALGQFNSEYGNKLYLLEKRPDENWEEAANFGYSKNIVGTEKMLEKIFEDNDNRVDQLVFVKARLFDMFIGDWSRHEDQWRWATFEEGNKKIYKAIPRDRDQAYTKLDGILLSKMVSAAGGDHLETFGATIKDVAEFNFPARNLDRQLANELNREHWVSMAKELQQNLTDKVIEDAIKKLPPEVFPHSGNEIIGKLKSRRDRLVEYAEDYYLFLAKEVEITGTKVEEYFEINILNNTETEVNIFDINKNGKPKEKPFYSRKFLSSETNEIRLYGLAGDDKFIINNRTNNPIKIRIIGGTGKNVYKTTAGAGNIHIYDNVDNNFSVAAGIKKHLTENPFVHFFNYEGYNYNSIGVRPSLFYASEDHIYTGLKFHYTKQQWRKFPFGHDHALGLRYSITEKSFSIDYKSTFTQLIGKWDVLLHANYDFMRWNNFFGIGNETEILTADRDYHRVRSHEFWSEIRINRNFGAHHNLSLAGNYQSVNILVDEHRFFYEQFNKEKNYNPVHIAGANLNYSFKKIDNSLLPTKGMTFSSSLSYTKKLNSHDSTLTRYNGLLNLYFPLSKSFVLYIRTGAAHISGKPEFFQLNKLGSGKTLRGFRRYRYYGETMFYNQNELQFIRNVKTGLFNGKAGLLALYDIGRVWHSGENSNIWHAAIGGGIILAPFNKIAMVVTYAQSKNEHDFSVRFSKPF